MSKRKNTPPETAECPRLGIERREIERGCFRKGAMVVHLRLSVMIITLLFEQDISTLKTKLNDFMNKREYVDAGGLVRFPADAVFHKAVAGLDLINGWLRPALASGARPRRI
jgi:hypothetical protein